MKKMQNLTEESPAPGATNTGQTCGTNNSNHIIPARPSYGQLSASVDCAIFLTENEQNPLWNSVFSCYRDYLEAQIPVAKAMTDGRR